MNTISKLCLCFAVAGCLTFSGCGEGDTAPKNDDDKKEASTSGENLNASADTSSGEMTLVSIKLPKMT